MVKAVHQNAICKLQAPMYWCCVVVGCSGRSCYLSVEGCNLSG